MPTRYQTRHQTLQSCHVGFVFISCQSIQEPSGLNSLPQSFTCTRRLQIDNDIIKDVPILSSGGRRSWLLSSLRVSKKTKCCRPWLIGKKVRKQKITKSGTALFVGKKVAGGNSAGVCVGLCGCLCACLCFGCAPDLESGARGCRCPGGLGGKEA